MADAKTEKQKVKEITDKLEEGLKELLATVEGYEDFIKAVTYVSPVPVNFEDIPGDSKGYFSPAENRIGVQEGMNESQTLKTMVELVKLFCNTYMEKFFWNHACILFSNGVR